MFLNVVFINSSNLCVSHSSEGRFDHEKTWREVYMLALAVSQYYIDTEIIIFLSRPNRLNRAKWLLTKLIPLNACETHILWYCHRNCIGSWYWLFLNILNRYLMFTFLDRISGDAQLGVDTRINIMTYRDRHLL